MAVKKEIVVECVWSRKI